MPVHVGVARQGTNQTAKWPWGQSIGLNLESFTDNGDVPIWVKNAKNIVQIWINLKPLHSRIVNSVEMISVVLKKIRIISFQRVFFPISSQLVLSISSQHVLSISSQLVRIYIHVFPFEGWRGSANPMMRYAIFIVKVFFWSWLLIYFHTTSSLFGKTWSFMLLNPKFLMLFSVKFGCNLVLHEEYKNIESLR